MKRWLAVALVISFGMLHAWLLTTEHPRVWPVRNTLHYRVQHAWWDRMGYPSPDGAGTLVATVTQPDGTPIPGARVLLAAWDGATWSGQSGPDGMLRIEDVPDGTYHPVAGAPGYESRLLGGHWGGVRIEPGAITQESVVLAPAAPPAVAPGEALRVGAAQRVCVEGAMPGCALRHALSFQSNGRPNQRPFCTCRSPTHTMRPYLRCSPSTPAPLTPGRT